MPENTRQSAEAVSGDHRHASPADLDTEPASANGADPPGLNRARRVAYLLDESLRVPVLGVRVGLDPLVGVLPIGGDVVAAMASLYIVAEAAKAGVPRRTLAKMLGLVAVDTVVGSVPVVGVLLDAFWTANRWNVAMFEEHLNTG